MMQRQMQRIQRGFTLIELMIVVAIIGILAAIAIPQYQDYVTRSRWSDTYYAVGSLKAAIAECVQNNNNTIGGLCDTFALLNNSGFWSGTAAPSSKYGAVVTLTANTGAIVMTGTASNQLGGCTVTLTPSVQIGNIQWVASTSAGCTRSKTGV